MALLPCYDGIVAHAGGTQAAAYPLQEGVNRVVTVGTAADSVVLPSTQEEQGLLVVVINAAAANAMNVYPAVGDQINILGVNAAMSVAVNKCVMYWCTGPGKWHSVLTA
jgi:hypothetical protein